MALIGSPLVPLFLLCYLGVSSLKLNIRKKGTLFFLRGYREPGVKRVTSTYPGQGYSSKDKSSYP